MEPTLDRPCPHCGAIVCIGDLNPRIMPLFPFKCPYCYRGIMLAGMTMHLSTMHLFQVSDADWKRHQVRCERDEVLDAPKHEHEWLVSRVDEAGNTHRVCKVCRLDEAEPAAPNPYRKVEHPWDCALCGKPTHIKGVTLYIPLPNGHYAMVHPDCFYEKCPNFDLSTATWEDRLAEGVKIAEAQQR